MNGFTLIDKKKGISSFYEVKRIKKLYNEKRVGHAGTLDPFADGVLILALGRYTKLFFLFDECDKEYLATGVFGEKRDTDDIDGSVIEKYEGIRIPSFDEIDNLIKAKYTGSVIQMPPIYSAKKINGKRAYSLAREGKSFDIKPVEIFIHKIELIDYVYPRFTLKISVSKGTYIRSIIRDIGDDFLIGAYTEKLTRTRIGHINISYVKESKENILSFKDIFPNIPSIIIDNEKDKKMILNGNRHFIENLNTDAFLNNKYIALFDIEDNLFSLIDIEESKYAYVHVALK